MIWHGKYIGLPFGEGAGQLTCWGLVRRVYADQLGIELPTYGEISAHDLARIARAMEAVKDDGWEACDPEEYAVCLMRSGRGGPRVVHVGVMVDQSRVLHIERATSACVIPLSHFSVAGRIIGFRRLV